MECSILKNKKKRIKSFEIILFPMFKNVKFKSHILQKSFYLNKNTQYEIH
jgi:hypothetical protein